MEEYDNIEHRLDGIEKKIDRLVNAMVGDKDMGTTGVVQRVEHFETALNEHERLDSERFSEIKTTHKEQNEKIEDLISQSKGIKVFVAVMGFLALLLTIYKGFQDTPFKVGADIGYGTPFEQLL